MTLDKVSAIRLLEKYKKISQILGLREDEALLDELMNIVGKSDSDIEKEKASPKGRWGETDFQKIISEGSTDLSKYELNDSIVLNKENIISFWSSQAEEDKSKFTIFELNVILYLISPQYSKYQKKDKQKIIRFIDQVVRGKKLEDSYKTIKV